LVAEGVLDFFSGFAKEVVGVTVGKVSSFLVFNVEPVALFRAKATSLGQGDVLLGASGVPSNIGGVVQGAGMKGVGASIYCRLSDGAFKQVHDLNKKANGVLISGKAVQDLITMGDKATYDIKVF
jgi:hypothetical protein